MCEARNNKSWCPPSDDTAYNIEVAATRSLVDVTMAKTGEH
jgi:hypothetical protein